MPVTKKHFSAKYLNNKIYIVGVQKYNYIIYINNKINIFLQGQTDVSDYSSTCEVYDLETRKWETLDNLSIGVRNPILIPCDDYFLFKFGGINKFGYIEKSVERYNLFKCNFNI